MASARASTSSRVLEGAKERRSIPSRTGLDRFMAPYTWLAFPRWQADPAEINQLLDDKPDSMYIRYRRQLSASLKVRVVEPVKTLKIETKTNTPVNVGEKLAIEYTIQPENATDKSLTWESSDPAIATVDNAGVVTAVAPGKVTISAATTDGSKKQAKVGLYIPSLRCETSEITVDKP